jgi:hypothetical protein
MTITKRTTKGSALTYGEMDENIRDLYEDTTIDRVLQNGNITTRSLTVGELNIGSSGDISFPTIDGTAGQFLKTDGAGNLSFANVNTTVLVEDLNGNNKNISSVNTLTATTINVTGEYQVDGTTRQPVFVTYGTGGGSNFSVNPPSGFSMSNLAGFIPSIRYIYFSGGVDGNDTLSTTYSVGESNINVDVRNSEQRSSGEANWIALWYVP